ncbi:hypothetical protein CCACVL1_10785 [Corchorus capsularis]|uniref:DUF2828 domain-containing protein n=1 Tax=Corchorus capsularis TaxID=210143 RepID=A0A1R3IPN5_COCAP|nr:hypothetical protein CCACVL1_10785 [Corchorus capsularis]
MAINAILRYTTDVTYQRLCNEIVDLFVKLLRSDLEILKADNGKTSTKNISLASKWCPSLDSSYDRATLFYEIVARKLFPYDSPEYQGMEDAHNYSPFHCVISGIVPENTLKCS